MLVRGGERWRHGREFWILVSDKNHVQLTPSSECVAPLCLSCKIRSKTCFLCVGVRWRRRKEVVSFSAMVVAFDDFGGSYTNK